SFAVLLVAAAGLARWGPSRRRFALALALAGAVGLAGTLVGSRWHYALLFQAQPYRIMWIAKVTQVALGFALIFQWGRSGDTLPRYAALGLAVYFSVTNYLTIELVVLGLALPLCCVLCRGLEAAPRHADWPCRAAALSVLIGIVVWATY